MKKFKILLTIMIIITCAVGLIACDDSKDNTYVIEKVSVGGGVLSWSNVQADFYKVTLKAGDGTVHTYSVSNNKAEIKGVAPGRYTATIIPVVNGVESESFTQVINVAISDANRFVLEKPVVMAGINGLYSWAAVPSAKNYEVSIYNGDIKVNEFRTMETYYNLPNSLKEGEYTISVRALTEALYHNNSAAAVLSFSVKTLGAIKSNEIVIDSATKVIKWNAVAGASFYKVTITLEKNGTTREINVAETSLDAKAFITSEGATNFKVKVQACSDDPKFKNGEEGDRDDEFKALPYPTGVTFDVTKTLRWNAVTGATAYLVTISPLVGASYIIETNSLSMGIEATVKTEAAKLGVTDKGLYTLSVVAIDSTKTFAPSEAAVCPTAYINAAKLSAPSATYNANNGKISWQAIANAESYKIYIGDRIFDVPSDNNNKEFDVSQFMEKGAYTIQVEAQGNKREYLTSDKSNALVFEKLPALENLRIEAGKLVWNRFEDSASVQGFDYKVALHNINGVYNTSISVGQTNSIDLGRNSNIPAGEWMLKVYISAVGTNGTTIVVPGNQIAFEDSITKLGMPTEAKYNNGKILIKGVENALRYTISFGGEVKNLTANYDGYIEYEKIIDQAGAVNLVIACFGDGIRTFDSTSGTLEVYKLHSVQNVSIVNGVLSWEDESENKKFNGLSYEIYIGSIIGTPIFTTKATSWAVAGLSVGQNNLYVIATSSDARTIPSDNYGSEFLPVFKLDKPIIWSDTKETAFKWNTQNANVNNKFEFEFIDAFGNAKTGSLSTNQYVLNIKDNPFVEGRYKLTVTAKGNAINLFDSDSSFIDHIVEKLKTPYNINVDQTNLTFNCVGATNGIKVELFENSNFYENGIATHNIGGGLYEYKLNKLPNAGRNILRLQALGDNFKSVSSDYSATIEFVVDAKKLDAPMISVSDNIISWASVAYANGYELQANKGGVITKHNISDYAVGAMSFDLNRIGLIAGEYEISMLSKGDNAVLSDSVLSNTANVTVYPSVTNIKIAAGVVSFTSTAAAGANYSIIFSDVIKGSRTEFITSTVSFDTRGKLMPGTYNIDIKAIKSVNAGAGLNVISSVVASYATTITKLLPVMNFAPAVGGVQWTKLEGAIKYKVVIAGSAEYEISQPTNENTIIAKIAFDIGSLNIIVVACGDGVNLIDSEPSDNIRLSKLETPTAVKVFNRAVYWNVVPGVTEYIVTIVVPESAAPIEILVKTNSLVLNDSICNIAGDYKISVRSKGNGLTTYDSIATPLLDYALALFAPTDLRVDGNLITWKIVNGAETYKITIDGVETSNIKNTYYQLGAALAPGKHTISVVAVSKVEAEGTASYKNSDAVEQVVVVVPLVLVKFDAKGGQPVGSLSFAPNNGQSVSLPVPIRTNYVFTGWYDDLGNKVETLAGVSANLELSARWEKQITSIVLISDVNKKTYTLNEAIKYDGGKIRITYADGTYEDLLLTTAGGGNLTITKPTINTATAGKKTINITVKTTTDAQIFTDIISFDVVVA